MKSSLLLAALLTTFVAFQAQADVVNGGFELPVQGNNSWSIYDSIDGWVPDQGGVEVRNNVAGAAHSGSNYVELDTTKNSGIFQDLTTVAGQQYSLSFWYSPRERVNAISNGIDFFLTDGELFDNLLSGSVTGDGGNAGNQWENHTYNFTAIGTTTRLLFLASGVSDSYGGSLDDVSVTAAVPEPETYAMLMAGLGVMGVVARRRKQNSVI